jgi:hypothetical protein
VSTATGKVAGTITGVVTAGIAGAGVTGIGIGIGIGVDPSGFGALAGKPMAAEGDAVDAAALSSRIA